MKKSKSLSLVAVIAVVLLVCAQVLGAFGMQTNRQAAFAQETTAMTSGSAENNTLKDEVVYTRTQAQGSVENIYVVNTLRPTIPGMVTDYGIYSSVENLSNLNPITNENGAVTVEDTTDSISYQGNLQSKALPWNFTISYYLDGREVSSTDLAGQSGALKLVLKTTKNSAVDATYYDNYLLQISVALGGDKAKNIQTSDGQIALVGTDTQVTFTGMPEADHSFGLTAQVSDFEMEGISIAAVPMSFAIESPDMEGFLSGFNQLTDGVGQLDAGADQLASGVQDFSNGMSQMASGASKLSANMNLLIEGAEGFRAGLKSLDTEGQTIAGVSSGFSSGLQGLSAAAGGLSAMMADPGFQAFLDDSPYKAQYEAALDALGTGVPTTATQYKKFDASLQIYMDGVSEVNSKYDTYANGLVEALGGARQLADGVVATNDGASQLAAGANELSSGTNTLYTEVQGMPDEVQKQIDDMLASYDRSDYKPKSFTSPKNTNVELVQFVISTDPIEVPDVETPAQTDEDEGFVSRLLALFGM